MTAALLRTAGEALYGSQWQSQLARDLLCNIRTMQRYAAGTHEPPPSIWQEIGELLQARRDAIDMLLPRVWPEADPQKYG